MKYALLCLLAFAPLLSEEESYSRPSYKQQIVYLAQKQDCKGSIKLYKDYKEELKRHDFEILQQIATVWIEQSARSTIPEQQVLGIFGFGVAGLTAPFDILEQALVSKDPMAQSAAIGFLGKLQEDYADILLNKAMSSSFLYSRLEAAYFLAERKSKNATGQIESLMYRLPPQMHYFFPEFFAMIGTSEAIHILRHLMDDSFYLTKIGAILSAAKYGRDDLLPPIRASITHLNNAEQEACAAALGYLKDIRSLKKLKKLLTHSSSLVQLAAANALFLLGDPIGLPVIENEAKNENSFAISLLADIPGYEEVLVLLLKSSSMQVRFNAASSLLHKKDPRSLQPLLEFLIKDSKDIGFQPQFSLGGSLKTWKIVPSLVQHAEESFFNLGAMSVALREFLITEALELPEPYFLDLARVLFETKQNELIPVLVAMLENLATPGAIHLLKTHSQKAGAPLIRTYCNLALFRLKEPGAYKENILNFLKESSSHQLIRFRSNLPWNLRLTDGYHLTPEESSSLLISAYESVAFMQEEEGITILLDAISESSAHNRPVLAGILMRILQ